MTTQRKPRGGGSPVLLTVRWPLRTQEGSSADRAALWRSGVLDATPMGGVQGPRTRENSDVRGCMGARQLYF